MSVPPIDTDVNPWNSIIRLLGENDEMLLESVRRLYEDLDDANSYVEQLANEFDRVYEELNKTNRQLFIAKLAMYFMKQEISQPGRENSQDAWKMLNILISGSDEPLPPMPEGFGGEPIAPGAVRDVSIHGYANGKLLLTTVEL